jgi:hypothetical protein
VDQAVAAHRPVATVCVVKFITLAGGVLSCFRADGATGRMFAAKYFTLIAL